MRIILTGPKFCLGESMQKNKGFTLIELMVTIGVLAIIASIAVPSFGNLVAKQRLNTTAKDFALMIGEARGQAISLKKNITIKLECPKNNITNLPECPENSEITFYWETNTPDIELTSEKEDVIFSGMGLAKQRTIEIPNPSYDPSQNEDLTTTPPTNPQKIQKILPLEFVFCNKKIKENRTVFVSNVGTVDAIQSGVCS